MIITLLHGNFGSPHDWDDLRAPLAARLPPATFHTPDLWSFLAPAIAQPLGALSDEIEREWREFSAPRILIGYSLGARLALQIAAARPDLVDLVVAISAHPGLRDESERGARRAHDERWARRFEDKNAPWNTLMSEWNSQGVLQGGQIPDQPELGRDAVARGFRDWSLGALPPTWDLLSTARIPIGWITGSADHKFASLAAQVRLLNNPNITFLELPGVGHRVVLERPREVAEWISLFVEDRYLQGPPSSC